MDEGKRLTPEEQPCKPDEEKPLKRMMESRFLDHIYENYQAGQRYCFVLGAGASKTSKIRTGEELMREWRDHLKEKGAAYVADAAAELELKPEDYEYLFSEDYDLKNDDYFTLFDLRFAGKPTAAYAYLEKEMEGKYPSYGYHPLAMLLSNTENRLVITTNFDSLIEDALYTYTFRHPLVVGHESLASYITNDTRHPVIAKIHRDLLFQPLNRKADMNKLKEEWEKPLRNALSRYIPIVIGYGGGDRTFMSLLKEMDLKGIYWCHLGEPSEAIRKIVQKQNGYLVKILGFDEIMFQLGNRFGEETKFDDPRGYIRSQAEKRCELYGESVQEITDKYSPHKDTPDSPSYSGEMRDDAFKFAGEFNQYVSRSNDENADGDVNEKLVVLDALLALVREDYEKAAELYGKAILFAPKNANYYSKRSLALHKLKRYEESLQDITTAIGLEPSAPEYYYSRGVTLHEMKRYEEALQDKSEAIKLDPSNPKYYYSRGVTLHAMKHYEEALQDKSEAVKLDPSNPMYHDSRSVTLHAMKRYEEALQNNTEAIKLEPSNPRYYHGRGITLHGLGRYEEALRDKTAALKLDPSNPRYYDSRSATLHELERYEEALQDATKAIELAPSNPRYYDSRSTTLHAMERYEEALEDVNKAIELDPSNPAYYDSRGITLHEMGRYEEALMDKNKAIELDPTNPEYYTSRATTLRAMDRLEEAEQDDAKAAELSRE